MSREPGPAEGGRAVGHCPPARVAGQAQAHSAGLVLEGVEKMKTCWARSPGLTHLHSLVPPPGTDGPEVSVF